MLPSPARARPRSVKEIFFFCAPEGHHDRPGDARAMQAAVTPPPCNGSRGASRRAALCCGAVRHCMLRGPACCERCDTGLHACRFCVLRRTCGVTDPWHAWGGGSRAWRELVVRGSCSVERAFRWGCGGWGWAVGRLGGWARVWKGGAGGGEIWVLEGCDGLGVRTASLLLGGLERV